jgi:hypothetical protein
MKTKACSSTVKVPTCNYTRYHVPADCIPHSHQCKNQKSYAVILYWVGLLHKPTHPSFSKRAGNCPSQYTALYRSADKSLARPTSQCILFDGENISFDASLVIYINSTNISPIMIINRTYEHQNLLLLQLVSFLVRLRTYQHPCNTEYNTLPAMSSLKPTNPALGLQSPVVNIGTIRFTTKKNSAF